jgi:hypothetical protein
MRKTSSLEVDPIIPRKTRLRQRETAEHAQ